MLSIGNVPREIDRIRVTEVGSIDILVLPNRSVLRIVTGGSSYLLRCNRLMTQVILWFKRSIEHAENGWASSLLQSVHHSRRFPSLLLTSAYSFTMAPRKTTDQLVSFGCSNPLLYCIVGIGGLV